MLLRRRAGTLLLMLAVLGVAAGCGRAPAHASSPAVPPPSTRTATAPSASAAGALRVVGLGDSVTSGEHCACDDYVTGFGHLLAQHDGVHVSVTNDGESGSTSAGLAAELHDDRSLRSDLADADVVVVTAGANDLYPALRAWRAGSCGTGCSAAQVEGMGGDLGRLLDTVDGLRPAGSRVLVTTYWNVFTDGAVAGRAERSGYLAWSDGVTRQANAAIVTAAQQRGATPVDLYTPFKGDGSRDPTGLLAADGDHPDAAGTALISRTVLDAYEAPR